MCYQEVVNRYLKAKIKQAWRCATHSPSQEGPAARPRRQGSADSSQLLRRLPPRRRATSPPPPPPPVLPLEGSELGALGRRSVSNGNGVRRRKGMSGNGAREEQGGGWARLDKPCRTRCTISRTQRKMKTQGPLL